MRGWLAIALLAAAAAEPPRDPEALFAQALVLEKSEGKLDPAIRIYEQIVREHPQARPVASRALLRLGGCYEKLGRAQAQSAYERLIRDYPEQRTAVERARMRLRALVRQPEEGPRLVRVLAGLEQPEHFGIASGDGRYFPVIRGNHWRLFVRDLTTAVEGPIADGPADHAAIAPNGQWIAYRARAGGTAAFQLRIVRRDGTGGRLLFTDPAVSFFYTGGWAPDGSALALVLGYWDRSFRLAEVSLASGACRVFNVSGRTGGPRYSPDGRHIAYTRFPPGEGGARDIDVLDRASGESRPLIEHPSDDVLLEWAASGGIVFRSNRAGSYDAWYLPVRNGTAAGPAVLVKKDLGQVMGRGMTRDGALYYVSPSGTGDVYISGLGGLEPKRLPAEHERSNTNPGFSPDGTRIAYAGAKGSLVVSAPDGSGRRVLPAARLACMGPIAWSPDGGSILIATTARAPGSRFATLNLASGTITDIPGADRPEFCTSAVWTPDGSEIVYDEWSRRGQRTAIRRRDVRTGVETALFEAGKNHQFSAVTLSPAGDRLAFALWHGDDRAMALCVAPLAGGSHRELFRAAMPEILTAIAFTPDGRSLIFARDRRPGASLWRIGVEGGPPEELSLKADRIEDLTVSRTGLLAYTGDRVSYELWAMQGFLPKQ